MPSIAVIGLGLNGDVSTETARHYLQHATVIAGSPRHLATVELRTTARSLPLRNWQTDLAAVRQAWEQGETVVILASGDPLFFGLGRLLLTQFPPEGLVFEPHLSAVQLAFSRVKVPWQDAVFVSVHGRDLEILLPHVQRGAEKLAILTDRDHSPSAIAQLMQSLQLPHDYQFWVCENLGSEAEQVQCFTARELIGQTFAPLNVLILLRQAAEALDGSPIPLLGIPDRAFLSFPDRPGLMTKREIRLVILGELALQPGQVMWDIGAGTGSVAIEAARLVRDGRIFAVEKTAMGIELIGQNCQRFEVTNVSAIAGAAPDALANLPSPDRVFIGGSGGNLGDILSACDRALPRRGKIVCAFATLEHQHLAGQWFEARDTYAVQWLQVNVARSIPVAHLHRLHPLNPVMLLTATKR